MKRIIWFILFFFHIGFLFSQIGKEFWFVAPDLDSLHGDNPIYMRIATLDDTAHIIFRMPANLSFAQINKTIPPNTSDFINLTPWKQIIENKPPNTVLNRGLLLTSDKDVSAYYECANTSNPGIFGMKGDNALGIDFYVVSQNNYANHNGSETFDIVATEDNTVVTITPSDSIVGHQAGVTFQVTLNKGETFTARAVFLTAAHTLAGSHITSNLPIAVTWQDDSIITGGWDVVCDQTIPVNILGKDYIVVKGFADNNPPNDDDERVYILAIQDATSVQIDGTNVATLNTSQQYDYAFPAANNTAVIKASKPVYVLHISGHPGEAGGSIIPQDSCTGSRKIGFTRTNTNAFALFILTRNGNQDSFYLNGSNSIITGPMFNVVPGTSNNWVYYRQNNLNIAQVPVGGNRIWNTKGSFHLGILHKTGASAEYGYFSNFASLYLGADASMCPGDSILLDGGSYMTSYEWKKLISGMWTLIDTNRFYTVHDTGYFACQTNGDFCTLMDTIHIGYYPNATVSLGNDRMICQGTTTTFDPGLFQSYLWSTGATTRYLTTGQGGSYWVRVVNNNNCIARDTVNLFIDSLPQTTHVIIGPAQVCEYQNNVLYTIANLPFATSYAWTLPPGATGTSTTSSISLNFPTSAVSGLLKVHGHNNCGNGPDTSIYITVQPEPHLTNNPLKKYICSNTSTNIILTSDVPGATFTWTASGSSPQVTGYTTNNTPSITLNDLLINASYNIETVTYHITPHANGCDGPLKDYDVYVYPVPNLSNTPLAKTQCNNLSTNITLISGVTGTLFTWTASGSSPLITGYTTNNTPSITINDILVNTGFSIETVTYHITPHANNCNGIIYNYTVTVYPTPDLSNTPPGKSQCNNLSTNITLTSNVTGTLFTWTAIGSSPQVTGYTTNNTPSVTINDLLINSGFNTETVTYMVTATANSCNSIPVPFTVTVYPVPDVYFTPASQTICPQQTSNITNNSHVSFPSFIWAASGSSGNVSGFSAGSGNLIQQTLNNSSYNIETVTYHVTAAANGCTGISANVVVTIDPAPVVTFTACQDPVITTDAQPVKLKGGNPSNGTYTGTGVTGTTFFPAISGPGSFKITYSYVNKFGCNDTASQTFIVVAPLSFTCGNSLIDPRDNKQYPTVQIGAQCWIAANLDYGTMIPGNVHQRDNCIPEKYCFNDLTANCLLGTSNYQWDELMQYSNTAGSQGLCPPGWHVPTENDWNILFNLYQGNGFAGSPLKSTGFSGFNALLSGVRFQNRSWSFSAFATFFWSSNPRGNNKAWAHGMNDYDPSVSFYPSSRANAFSVRCLKD